MGSPRSERARPRAHRLLGRTGLRALKFSLCEDPVPVRYDADPDPELVGLATTPLRSIDGTLARLTSLETLLRARGDRRSVFLTIYSRMTGAIRSAINAGVFADPDWIAQYTVAFAEYYRQAFLAYEQGRLGNVPFPWRIAFDMAVNERGLIIQDALLGINAHINYDLALTLVDVGTRPNREQKRQDHLAVNDVLGDLIDAQQTALTELYTTAMGILDNPLGSFDEAFALYGIEESREHAWRLGVTLADTDSKIVRAYARWLLRNIAAGAAAFIRSPPVSEALLRQLEIAESEGMDTEMAIDHLGKYLDLALPY